MRIKERISEPANLGKDFLWGNLFYRANEQKFVSQKNVPVSQKSSKVVCRIVLSDIWTFLRDGGTFLGQPIISPVAEGEWRMAEMFEFSSYRV